MEVFSDLNSEVICLLKIKIPKSFLSNWKKFKLDIIFDKPSYVNLEKIVLSVTGSDLNLKLFEKFIYLFGKCEILSVKNTDYVGNNLLVDLTKKQKEIYLKAKELGYYNYPRKVSLNGLSGSFGISKSTLIEHLRKIENKILNRIN